ncbi:MAG: 4-hydroxy-tetrahydrodipicolinate synthase [Prolixibacteraceae bacterium]|jgi:4-hydroxy-tetrahydrodipicolinate synthase|nr:4-hydroxy-tetrahydrodipicolinate synthase [Prolixibacteraceae bacterium]MBT6765544.1 4-hydroxy-tetrahydrodipicolinate synthase [Prolixibacteraceae bacterium]MBT7000735.1 4-hydroxy-tetrahydrodipicolinate synthase [Prolixibacteraceae bacterium]MBT7394889.1 4-hydroxy-tetrahydrodipicolinate synthase [Prolixibacteraceae bacterium]
MSQFLTGAGVALITPFLKNNEVDFKALENIVENQVKGDIDYLVALGTTAETPTLTSQEKLDVVSLIKEKSAGLPVVVGMGGNDTRTIINQINQFNFEGVSSLLIVTPYYNKPSQEGMFNHYVEIAKACPVPIILYNVPSRTGVNLEAETVVRLAETSDKFVAVKEASGIMSQITKIAKYTPDNFSVISGDDVLALPIISIGGSGVISVAANALPGKLSSMIHLVLDGKYNEARKLHFEMIDMFQLLFKEGNPGGVKALMNIQGTIENELRSPLYKISEKTYNEIRESFRKLK